MTVKGKKAKRGAPGERALEPPLRGRKRRQTTLYIVCEGHTERDYFQDLEQRYGEERGFSLVLYPRSQPKGGLDAVNAVDTALSAREELHKDDWGNIWAVFDLDDHKNIPQSIRLARENDINVAFSAPSFDLWLLLHLAPGAPSFYGDDKRLVLRDIQKTRPSFKDYGKDTGSRNKRLDPARLNDLHTAEKMPPATEQAMSLARALVARCSSGRCSPSDIPGAPGHAKNCDVLRRDTSTDVYRILEVLEIG